MDLFSDRSY